MITIEINHFDLRQIAGSGQCFRMVPCDPNRSQTAYRVISSGHFLIVEQHGEEVTFHCPDDEFTYWEYYFDIGTDYDAYIRAIDPADEYLAKAASFGSGIRILNQDLWEMIITFLISQQNHITRIRGCIERLCACYGDKKVSREGVKYYSFPGPEALALATEAELRELGMGYRARYLVETARSIAEGEVSLEKIFQMRYYSRAKKELMRLSGVGEKVADCICLFALHHMDAFPVDTHIRQVLEIHYKRGFPNRRYHGMRGIMQQYIFYYELMKGRK